MWAVVPIKGFDTPKQRLAGVLSPDERSALAEHMLDRNALPDGGAAVLEIGGSGALAAAFLDHLRDHIFFGADVDGCKAHTATRPQHEHRVAGRRARTHPQRIPASHVALHERRRLAVRQRLGDRHELPG